MSLNLLAIIINFDYFNAWLLIFYILWYKEVSRISGIQNSQLRVEYSNWLDEDLSSRDIHFSILFASFNENQWESKYLPFEIPNRNSLHPSLVRRFRKAARVPRYSATMIVSLCYPRFSSWKLPRGSVFHPAIYTYSFRCSLFVLEGRSNVKLRGGLHRVQEIKGQRGWRWRETGGTRRGGPGGG